MTVLDELAECALAARGHNDERAREWVRLLIADTAGCRVLGAGHPMATGIERWLRGDGSLRARLIRAATLTHVDEFDAIHPASAVLPTATVVPAAIEVAADEGRPDSAVVEAVIAGSHVAVEAGLRFGGASLYERRWWPTALFGGLAAATAAATLLELDQDRTADALSLIASSLGGLLSDAEFGAGHYLLLGRAAADGVGTAYAAAAGLTAARSLLDDPAATALGRRAGPPSGVAMHLLDARLKAYPCARPLHAVVSCVEHLLAQGVSLSSTDPITVLLPAATHGFVSTVRAPRSPNETAASVPYVIAAAMAGRAGDPQFYREAGAVVAPAVEVGRSDELDAAFPQRWGATVIVHRAGGSSVSASSTDGPDLSSPAAAYALLDAKFGRGSPTAMESPWLASALDAGAFMRASAPTGPAWDRAMQLHLPSPGLPDCAARAAPDDSVE